MNLNQMVEALTWEKRMCEQERHDYEVMREQYEEEHSTDTCEWWDVSFGPAEEARGDYDHDQYRQREIDEA